MVSLLTVVARVVLLVLGHSQSAQRHVLHEINIANLEWPSSGRTDERLRMRYGGILSGPPIPPHQGDSQPASHSSSRSRRRENGRTTSLVSNNFVFRTDFCFIRTNKSRTIE